MGYQEIVQYIVEKATQLLIAKKIKDGVGKIDYVAIFPESEQEFQSLQEILKHDGLPVKVTTTGTVYKLNKSVEVPLEEGIGDVVLVKLRNFDPQKKQRGYIDYRVLDYPKFKMEYLSLSAVEVTENRDHVEMLYTEDPEVLIYFLEIPLGKNLI
jgi:hypothetical protein